jgi:SAM-dependent methyltransferase
VRGLTLVAPAFGNRRHAGLRLMRRLDEARTVAGPGGGALTRDPRRSADHDADPLARQPLGACFLLGLREAAVRVVADANAIVRPVQMLVAGADRIAHTRPQHLFFDRLGSTHKSRLELPDARHDALGDRDRETAVQAVRAFVLRLIDATPADVDLREAHLRGDTVDESQALAAPLPLLSPRNLRWSLMRLGIRVGTLSSNGLKLGHATGFDSGAMLDYVYQDQASGRHALGRRVDRYYLDALGWRALRTRRLHVEELIRDAMERLAEKHCDVRILDIASGPGRYVLDAVRTSPVRTGSVLLRDVGEECGRAARALIEERELAHIARFETGDAFDRPGLANLRPRPTLAVASGLYELYPANEMVRRSLAGVGDAVEDGGYFVYTNQPWHPQLELIARALVSRREHDGEPWVMRRRTQAEIDQLVEEAGFRKIAMRIDAQGIFTVSLAIRRE